MSVKLSTFVKININEIKSVVTEATRETVVLFMFSSTAASDTTISSLTLEDTDSAYNYAKYYFDNNGKKLRIIKKTETASKANLLSAIETLSTAEIVVASNASLDIMKEVATDLASKYASNETPYIERKLLLAQVPTNISASTVPSINQLVLVAGSAGIQMTVAAYLSNFNIDDQNMVKDYSFTEENVATADVIDDNTVINNLKAAHVNTKIKLLNSIKNIGGDDSAGNDLVNRYMLIILHQTLTERLINTLASKIRYTVEGLATIDAAIRVELNRYVANGYLSTDTIWDKDDLSFDGNVLIKKGMVLDGGFKYFISPLSSLSATDKRDHKLPTIYIVLSDSDSIREIEISGSVI